MDNDQLKQLFEKYKSGKATPQEIDFLDAYYKAFELRPDFTDGATGEQHDQMWGDIKAEIDARIDKQQNQAKTIRLWPRIAAAASILLFLSVGGYYLFHKQSPQQTAQNQNDIAPGSNKAILLSHGKKYSITDAKNGLIATQGNMSISKTTDGKLTYSGGANQSLVYDTLIVPRGGQHQLTLSDGTVAYLNADSKFRYPESFSGKERDVELISGEAILDVKHNAVLPFKLIVKGQEVRDIGTEFDVSAYNDEPGIKTTLIQGVVKITSAFNKSGRILKPGQQAVNPGNAAITIQDADIDGVTAWKDGKFLFNDEPLASIMRQASRWYNVDVSYEDESLKDKRFGGVTTRFANVSQLLNTLEMTGKVKFTIQGRKILVHYK
ncbi:MAG TPA: FecR domain-containing protein [Mucilaginibacter sp.]|jgi:hypothetical protein|nr:FecR domain-containing protein [Mucilaginibacter sp.]